MQVPTKLHVLGLDFGTGTEAGGSGLDGLTQYAATSALWKVYVEAAYPEACTIHFPGLAENDFRCWYASWD